MNRLIATNSVPLSGADVAPASGTPQYATDGNPATSTPPTIWPAYAWNMIQEEMMAILTKAGVTPSSTNLGQVIAALLTLFAPAVYTSSNSNSGTSISDSITFTPTFNGILDVDCNAGTSGTPNSAISFSVSGGTVLSTRASYINTGGGFGVGGTAVSVTAGTAVTVTATQTVAASATNYIAMTGIYLPKP